MSTVPPIAVDRPTPASDPEPLTPTQEEATVEAEGDLLESEDDLKFDLEVVYKGFQDCKKEDGQLHLAGYLRAYREVNKFFQILGSVFNFVASDVTKKINILQCYQMAGHGDYYYTIQSMLEYEQENNLLRSKDQQSGSRTLLRLHRALEFITGFLSELQKAEPETKLGGVTSEVYNRTLAKHHGWIVAKTVSAVLYMMPTKQTIYDRIILYSSQKKDEEQDNSNLVTGGTEAIREHNERMMLPAIEAMNSVYNLTQKLYEDYNCLDLP